MTILHDPILPAPHPMRVLSTVRDVSLERVVGIDGTSAVRASRPVLAGDDLSALRSARRERQWAIAAVEEAVRTRGTTPEEQLLALFDVFDELLREDDVQTDVMIKVVLEMGQTRLQDSLSAGYLVSLRLLVETLAKEARLRDTGEFGLSWRILMKGSVLSAIGGDENSAVRAKEMGLALIARHHTLMIMALPVTEPVSPDADLDSYVDAYASWDTDDAAATLPVGDTATAGLTFDLNELDW
jgi:hypothetical protein